MMRKLSWLALAVALAAPLGAAWAADGKAGNSVKADDTPSCSCPKPCPRDCPKPCPPDHCPR
jgi:hypothetical protein